MVSEKQKFLRELDACVNKGCLLEKWGKKALEDALNTHVPSTYNDTQHDDFVKFHVSRYKLKEVTHNLFRNRLVLMLRLDKPKGFNQQFFINESLNLVISNHVIMISISPLPDFLSNDKDNYNEWQKVFKDKKKTESRIEKCNPSMLENTWDGFQAGMHNYALQVAGLMHVNSLDDGPEFWQEYNKYITLIEPDKLAEQKNKADEFEEKMKFVVEAVPQYFSCTMISREARSEGSVHTDI